jgi:adenylyltransferase/sulfurtransferase
VHGSIFRFEGQVSVFDAARGPCYRCLYPDPPPPGTVPSCAEGGVLGVLPGLIGVVQAIETIKLVIGAGDPLIGRLLIVDALDMRFRELKLRRDPQCPMCGTRTITELIDYEDFCGVTAERVAQGGVPEMTVRELHQRRAGGNGPVLIDVREPAEWEIARIDGARLIPLRSLPERLGELGQDQDIVLQCHVGVRSLRAAEILQRAGFRNVWNLKGGIDAWSREIDPAVPRY